MLWMGIWVLPLYCNTCGVRVQLWKNWGMGKPEWCCGVTCTSIGDGVEIVLKITISGNNFPKKTNAWAFDPTSWWQFDPLQMMVWWGGLSLGGEWLWYHCCPLNLEEPIRLPSPTGLTWRNHRLPSPTRINLFLRLWLQPSVRAKRGI